MNYEREYTKLALGSLKPWLFILPDHVQRLVKTAQSVIDSNGFATSEEIAYQLGGHNWVIAKRTKAIVNKYGPDVITVSAAQYDAACKRAIDARFPKQ